MASKAENSEKVSFEVHPALSATGNMLGSGAKYLYNKLRNTNVKRVGEITGKGIETATEAGAPVASAIGNLAARTAKGTANVIGTALSEGAEKAGKGIGEGIGGAIEGATKGLGSKVGLGVLASTGIPYAGYKTLGYLFNPPAQDSVSAHDFSKLMQAKAFLMQSRQKIENQKMENLLKLHGAGVPLMPQQPQQHQMPMQQSTEQPTKLGSDAMRGLGLFGYRDFEKIAVMVRGKYHPNIQVHQGGGQPSSAPAPKPNLNVVQGGGGGGQPRVHEDFRDVIDTHRNMTPDQHALSAKGIQQAFRQPHDPQGYSNNPIKGLGQSGTGDRYNPLRHVGAATRGNLHSPMSGYTPAMEQAEQLRIRRKMMAVIGGGGLGLAGLAGLKGLLGW